MRKWKKYIVWGTGLGISVLVVYSYIHYRLVLSSTSCKTAQKFIENQEEIIQQCGKIEQYGIITSQRLKNPGKIKYIIPVRGTKRSLKVEIYLQQEKNHWQVKNYLIK